MRKNNQLLIMLLLSITINVFAQESKQTFSEKTAPNPIHWGVNIHRGGSDPQNVANKLLERNLKYVRMDLWGQDPVYLSGFLTAANIMKSKNIKIQVVVNSLFTNGQSRSQDYTADLAEVEQSVYNQIKPGIISTKDLVSEYELQNEVPLYPNMNLSGTTGQNASDYNTPAGRLQAAALRGMSRAIDDVRKQFNLPIRIILGTVGRDFGFISYMQQQGVLFDIVGYHIYPWEKHAPLDQDPWFGLGGPLGQLATFNKPIHINEFNSGEIYSGAPYMPGTNYENQAGQPLTETGYKGFYKHLNEIVNQTVANVESVYFYEIYDQTQNPIPENRFGLYYDTNLENPKISLLLASSFAGGILSPAEQDSLIMRNFTYNCSPDVIVSSVTYADGIFTSVVKNQGNIETPAGKSIGVGYFVDGISRTYGLVTGSLAPGATVTIGTTGGLYAIPAGTHTILAKADDTNRFEESNENNNQLSQSVTILPDVIVTSLSYVNGIFTSVVKNQGTLETPVGVSIGVGYFVDGILRTYGLRSGPLAPGASFTIGTTGGSYTIPTGTHTILAKADDINRFEESVENNNQLSQLISLLPDIIVSSVTYADGIFTSVVKNQGNIEIPAGVLIGVGYMVDGITRTYGLITGPLAVGSSVTIGTNGSSYTIPTGTHTIIAKADDANRFEESDENNNQLSQSILMSSYTASEDKSLSSKEFSIKNEQKITVFPNPTSDFVTINLNGITEKSQIEILNINGILVKIFEMRETEMINISDLKRGVYFIHLKNSSLQAQKIIKQ